MLEGCLNCDHLQPVLIATKRLSEVNCPYLTSWFYGVELYSKPKRPKVFTL